MTQRCAALALFLFLAGPVCAGGMKTETSYPPIPNPDDVISACHEASREKMESGVTAEMRHGALEMALCLEKAITENAAILVAPDALTPEAIAAKLKALRFAYGNLYWHIYNSARGCGFGCGTMYHVFHNGKLIWLYENMLRDVIEQRRKYGT